MMELGLWPWHSPYIGAWARGIVVMILSFLSLENRLITIIYWDRSHVTRLVINMRFLSYWCRASTIAMTAIQETRLRKRCSPSSRVLPHYPYSLWKARTKQNQATSWTEVIQTGSKDRQNRNCCVMPALDGSRACFLWVLWSKSKVTFSFTVISCQ